jgi:hypothetical protein
MAYDENGFTCKYVFFKFAGNEGGEEIRVDLGEPLERVPNVSIEVIQAKVVSPGLYQGITVKMLGQAMNYYGNDFRGTALALLDIGAKHSGSIEHYDLGLGRAPVLTMATTKSIIIRFSRSNDGVSIPINDTGGGALIFKLKYPRQPDQITAQYSSEIQRAL